MADIVLGRGYTAMNGVDITTNHELRHDLFYLHQSPFSKGNALDL